MSPEVSIIIPAYNSERYIGKAISSILNQTHVNFEAIVIDDASCDNTLKIVTSFVDRRLKIIKNSCNLGASAARNRALKQATGKWIALLDSDDWYASTRLEKLLEIGEQKNADMVADDLYLIVDRELSPWSTLLQERKEAASGVQLINPLQFIKTDRLTGSTSKKNWSLGYTKPLIKRDFLLKYGLQYNENIKIGEDFELYLKCLLHQARFFLLPKPYYFYRNRSSSLSTRTPIEYLRQSHQITQDLIDQNPKIKATLELHKAMKENLTMFEKRLDYYRAVESIKKRKVMTTIKQIVAKPHIIGYFVNKAIALITEKIPDSLSPKKSRPFSFNRLKLKDELW